MRKSCFKSEVNVVCEAWLQLIGSHGVIDDVVCASQQTYRAMRALVALKSSSAIKRFYSKY